MTLHEYRNQNPIKKLSAGEVTLNNDEVEFGLCLRIHSELHYVQISMKWIDYRYLLKSNDNTLWTTAEDGNPEERSVFAYNATEEEWEKFKKNGN